MSTPHFDDVYADDPWLSIRWDKERKCVHAEWKGFANSVQFRDGTLKILGALRDKHAAVLISDNRRLEGVVDADQLWLRDSWVPAAVAGGLTRIGVVVARRGLGEIASEGIVGRVVKTAFATRTFDSLEDATDWWVAETTRIGYATRRRVPFA